MTNPGPPNGGQSPLNPTQQGAFDLMKAQLHAWGLDALVNDLRGFIVAGDTSPDTLTLALSNTQAYKTRFAANDIRIANGLSALSPAEYLGMERQYKDVLQSYGLPPGFYDSTKDFTDFIGKDISASELDARAKIAHDQYEAAPTYIKNLWGQYFGGKGDAIAAILDPEVATQVIQDRANQVAIGGAAAQHGLQVTQPRAQELQQAGITGQQAQQAYDQIATALPTDQSIAQRFGTTFGQQAEENSLLLGDAEAAKKRQRLYSSEEGLFKQSPGLDASSLGISQEH